MRRSSIRRNWFSLCQILLFLVDVAALIAYSVLLKSGPADSREGWSYKDIEAFIVIMVRLGLSSINGLFLIVYGFYYTDTIFGTCAFQQIIYYPIVVILLTGQVYNIQMKECPPCGKPWKWMPIIGRALCDALISITLWIMLFRTQEFKDKKLLCMKINIYDLADGTHTTSNKSITWRGTRRLRGTSSLHALPINSIAIFCSNSLFRRVIPVEKKRQVFLQHILSLAAIVLLVIRTVSEVRKSYEDLPTRTIVKPCADYFDIAPWDSERNEMIFYTVRLSGYRDYNASLDLEMPEQPFYINILLKNMGSNDTNPCKMTAIHTMPDKRGRVDWFGKHECQDRGIRSSDQEYQYEFNVTQKLQNPLTSTSSGSYALSIWLGGPSIPEFGSHTIYKTHLAKRRYIISSLLMELFTGSDPTYNATFFFPASILSNRPVQVANSSGVLNTEQVATGVIYAPAFLESSKKLAISGFKPGQMPEEYLCEITEDYRVTSAFDALASIGGLLAFLQGVHILLFGRPLFWGMFGTKAITPFGLTGKLATKSFKKRLQERYHLPQQGVQANLEQLHGGSKSRDGADVNIDMTQFLLDFVIDMGPASVPNHEEEDKNRCCDSGNVEGTKEMKYGPIQQLRDNEGETKVTELQWVDTGTSKHNVS